MWAIRFKISGPAFSLIMKIQLLETRAPTLWDTAEAPYPTVAAPPWSLHIYTYHNCQRVNSSIERCELLERAVIVLLLPYLMHFKMWF